MIDVLTVAIPILIVDVANPVLLASVMLALTTPRPVAVSFAVIAGHTSAYFLVGALLKFGLADLIMPYLEPLVEWFNNPTAFDYVVSAILGLALLVIAWRWKIAPPQPSDKQPEKVTVGVGAAFGFGALINFVGIPFAVPYFAFLGNLFRIDSEATQMVVLVIYNFLYALPFLLLPLSLLVFGARIMPVLDAINKKVETVSAYIMPVMFALVGLGLIADAGLYFVTGQGLI